MGCMRFLLPVILLAMITFAADEPTGTIQTLPPSVLQGAVDTATAKTDSIPVVVPLPLPRCTLQITTDPPGASLSLDGTVFGTSPLNIMDVDTGTHTLVVQLIGYYQKKAVIALPVAQKTSLNFQLSAPGRLSVVTVPPEAAITINGANKGTTPYRDALIKPGTYSVSLVKEHYVTVDDSVTIASGEQVTLIDTLTFTGAYRDSLQQSAAAAQNMRKRFSSGFIAGAFGLFLLILLIIEKQE